MMMMVRHVWILLIGLGACASSPESLDLPADLSENGVPVGVRTVEVSGLTIEVWYPAAEKHRSEGGSDIDFATFITPSVQEAFGDIELPTLYTNAIRNADVRVPETPYPVVLFSHGFGGMRVQSNDITTHLASRGYVVAAADHIGRSMGDLLPCMFSPALEGCNLSGMGGDDPGPYDMKNMVNWMTSAHSDEADPLYGVLNLDALGVMGHSAGGGSTAALVNEDTRFKAAIPMAGTGSITRDIPVMVMDGTCDAIIEASSIEAIWAEMPNAGLARFRGAGHLAFSDLCDLEMGAFADAHLLPRDDINTVFLEPLLNLATDGCPEAPLTEPPSEDCADGYMDLDISQRGIRQLTTQFLDAALGQGDPFDLESTDPAIEWITP